MKPITMSAREAAEYLGVSYWMINDMAKKGKIPFISFGSMRLFRKESLDSWIEEQEKLSVEVEEEDNNQYGKLRKIM